MKQSKVEINRKKLLVSMLAVCLFTGCGLKAHATDISGVTGNNGIFNINPSDMKGDTGFRQYENFTLSQGDIANLIFKYGEANVAKFVNLVDNTININGIVNTMRDGNFYDGKAIFISPNGMVVGASGVLNVGSLSVLTPTTSDYENFKAKPTLGYYKLDQGNADVTINGKVIARDGIEISGRNVAINAGGGLMSGVNNTDVISSHDQADLLFNNLVNTSAITNARAFEAKDGKIVIKSNVEEGSVAVNGVVKNFGDGNINISNSGANGMSIGGTIENKGNSLIVNNKGNLNIDGTVRSAERINITNHGNELNVNGTIHNDNVLKVWNTGEGGTNLNGKIVNKNSAVVQNDKGAFNIGGKIQNDSNMSVISNGTGMNVTEDAVIENNGSLKMWNKGEEGIKIAGNIANNSKAVIQNYKGAMEISGNVTNADTLNLINNGTGMNVTETAKITNEGYTGVLNTGAEGMKFNGTVQNNKGNTILTNRDGQIVFGGSITNAKDAKVNITNHGSESAFTETSNINNNGTLKVWATGAQGSSYAGTVTNNGSAVLQNDNGAMTVSGKVHNAAGDLRLSNKGASMNFTEQSEVKNDGSITILNTSADGTVMGGTFANDGQALVSNQRGNLKITGNVKNNNKASFVAREGMEIAEGAVVENYNSLTMLNTGENGLQVAGEVKNNGSAVLSNKAGDLTVTGKVNNETGRLSLINSGNGKLNVAENGVIDNSASITVLNSGAEGTEAAGTVNNKGTLSVKNDQGKLKITGKIDNADGRVTITNNGTDLEVAETAQLTNKGSLSMVNNGTDGFVFNGNLDTSGNSYFTNNAGELTINGTVTGADNKLAISSKGGLTVSELANIDNAGTLTMLNNGEKGLTVLGTVKNNGRTLVTNNAGDLTVSGTIANENGQINLTNHGNAINVTESGKVTSDGVLKIWSTGDGGIQMSGTVENKSANSAIQSDKGSMNISGTVNNNGEKLYITNHGKDLTVTETANITNRGNVAVWDTAETKGEIKGNISSTEGKVIITRSK